MTYDTTTYVYGPSYLSLTYTKEELNTLINSFIDNNTEFSFTQLCNYILSVADQQNKLKKDANTSYSQIYLTHSDVITISKALWELIWKQRLIQVFNSSRDIIQGTGDTFFVVNK